MHERVVYRCSFCGKAQHEVKRLIAGPGAIQTQIVTGEKRPETLPRPDPAKTVYICNECVDLCYVIVHPGPEEEESAGGQRRPSVKRMPLPNVGGPHLGGGSGGSDGTRVGLGMHAALPEIVKRDPLTACYNSLYFDLLYKTMGTVALLYCDVCRMRELNNRHGSDSGDRVLVELGRRLREAFEPASPVFRLLSDEFAILLPDERHAASYKEIVEELIYALVPVPGAQIEVDMTIIAVASLSGEDAQAFRERAAHACSHAKRAS